MSSTSVFALLNSYLTHYWPFNNGGDMKDIVGLADMLLGQNTTFTTDRFGCLNSALNLNGGWTQIPSGIYFNTPEFTISAWVFPQQIGWGARLIDFSNGPGLDNIIVGISSNNVLSPYLCLWSGGIRVENLTQLLNLGQWHFITITFDGTFSRIYLNATLTTSISKVYRLPIINRTKCYIGKSAWSFDGYSASFLDDLRFFNKSLSQEQILELFSLNPNSVCQNSTSTTSFPSKTNSSLSITTTNPTTITNVT